MNKIKPITNSSLVNPLIASKINEIIGKVNELVEMNSPMEREALSDKEEEKNYPPIEELLKKGYIGGELEATPYKEKVESVEVVVCPIHGDTKYNLKPTHYCKYKVGEVCNCDCVCNLKQEECKSIHNPCPYGNDDCPSCTTKQSTSLKEEIYSKIIDYSYQETTTEETVNEILKLIQSHLVKEIECKLVKTTREDSDKEWSLKLRYNQAIYDIIKIINNITK